MRRLLFFAWLLSAMAWSQEMPKPPPSVMPVEPGKAPPFDPNDIREAVPQAEIQLPQEPAETSGPQTLVQLVDTALRLQPDIRSTLGQVRQANGQTTVLRSRLLPQLGGSANYMHLSSRAPGHISQTTDNFNNSLGVSWLLFDFANTQNRVREADLLRQALESDVLTAQNDVALDVKERYYTLLQAQRLVQVSESDVANRQEQLRLARALYEAGNMSPGDVVRAQTTVSTAVFSLESNRRQVALARQDLLQAMGLYPLTELEISLQAEPEIEHKDVPFLMTTAAQRRPELLAAQHNIDARQAGLDAAHTTNYPALTSSAGISYQGAVNGIQYPSVNLQLNIDFAIYDGGQRAGAIEAAEGLLEVAQAEYTRNQLFVQRQVAGALEQLLVAERNVESTAHAVDSASQGIRIAVGRYKAALGTVTDVFDAQNAVVSASTNYANSLAELDLARARLRHALADPFGEGYFAAGNPPASQP
jgi:outer membrane protein